MRLLMNAALALSMIAGTVTTCGEVLAQPAMSEAVDQPNLPIRRITLYRSGVGAFERRGLIEGDAKVQLRFDTKQINDILKSMVVLDLSKGQGRVEGVSYGSKEPLTKRLSSFAIDISNNPTIAGLLGQIRGAEVALKLVEGRETVGTVLGVETRNETVGKDTTAPVSFVNLMTKEGLVSIRLPQVVSFELRDEALKSELNKALAAVAEYRADRTKTVDIRFAGQGAREVMVGYIQESPVWKTSYRLILPDSKKGEKPTAEGVTVQGWAIVENTTDEDWNQVQLALVSGRPVSFTMDLYEPLYVARPDVPVPTVPGVAPRAYEGGAERDAAGKVAAQQPKAGRPARGVGGGGSFGAPDAAPGAPMMTTGRMEMAESGAPEPLSSEDLANYAARSQAAAMEVGEVFQFQLEAPVTVERQRSAMLPILSAGIEGKRVSIFNPADGGTHPMRGVWITNTSNMQLMPGPISVFDSGAYAGDAQIGHVPAGDRRLLSYAVDLDVDVTTNYTSSMDVRKVKVVKGVLEMTTLSRQTRRYDFTNKDAARDRLIVVEHPRSDGWTLKQPEKPAEQSAQTYRFEVEVAAGATKPFEIVEEIVSTSGYGVLGYNLETIMSYSQTGAASEKVVEAFREVYKKQGEIREQQERMGQLEREREKIAQDQDRIRQNMNSIDRNSDLYRRYMTKFTEQESRLETIAQETTQAQKARDEAQARLDAFIADLSVE